MRARPSTLAKVLTPAMIPSTAIALCTDYSRCVELSNHRSGPTASVVLVAVVVLLVLSTTTIAQINIHIIFRSYPPGDCVHLSKLTDTGSWRARTVLAGGSARCWFSTMPGCSPSLAQNTTNFARVLLGVVANRSARSASAFQAIGIAPFASVSGRRVTT